MDNEFIISLIILVFIVLYEFLNNTVIDLGFVSIITRNQHTKPKLLLLLLTQLFVWVTAIAIFWPLFRWSLLDKHGSSKGYEFIIFVVIVVPIYFLREPFAKWVKKMSKNKVNAN